MIRYRAAATDRALVHLLDYIRVRNGIEFPWEITQAGMAEVLRTRRSHVSLTLSSLREKGYVEDRLGRVENETRRRKVYFLTCKGYLRAMELKDRYLRKGVDVLMNGHLISVRIRELNGLLGEKVFLAEILSCIDEDGVLDIKSLKGKPTSDISQDPSTEHERRTIKSDSKAVAALHLLL